MYAKCFDADRQGAHDICIPDTPKHHDPTPAMIDRLHGEVVAEQSAPHRAAAIDNQDSSTAFGVDQFSNKGVILKTLDGLRGTGKFRLAAKVTENGAATRSSSECASQRSGVDHFIWCSLIDELALVNRQIRSNLGTNIIRARTNQSIVRPLLHHMGGPSGHARHNENWCENFCWDTHVVVCRSMEEVALGNNSLVFHIVSAIAQEMS